VSALLLSVAAWGAARSAPVPAVLPDGEKADCVFGHSLRK
jgi:hypothetical protein